ncbi:MAG: hypothetical protein ACE5GH_06395 [Fidelibacterota bacterium]
MASNGIAAFALLTIGGVENHTKSVPDTLSLWGGLCLEEVLFHSVSLVEGEFPLIEGLSSVGYPTGLTTGGKGHPLAGGLVHPIGKHLERMGTIKGYGVSPLIRKSDMPIGDLIPWVSDRSDRIEPLIIVVGSPVTANHGDLSQKRGTKEKTQTGQDD